MQKIQNQIARYREKGRRFRKWQKIITVLASIVVFCTVYALILPAITLEGGTYCGKKEHKHTDSCYEKAVERVEEKLVCEKEEVEPHQHTEDCYRVYEVVVESARSVKSVKAVEADSANGDTQAEGMSAEANVEAASVESVEEPEVPEAPEAPEAEEPQTEEKVETIVKKELICEKEETKGHSHAGDCYERVTVYGEKELICDKKEHSHTKICYSNPDADVETEEEWMRTFEDVVFTNDWIEDTIAIAESQLGYRESTENYEVTEDGSVKGYTRYGDFYGCTYGDWCAMYVSFCLNYANVEGFPFDAGCDHWIHTLKELEDKEYNAYQEASWEIPEEEQEKAKEQGEEVRTREYYMPERGNLIFFNWDSLADSDHVGIVVDVTTEDDETIVTTIEGNTSNTVKYKEYNLENTSIMGYGILPEQEFFCEKQGHVHDEDCYDKEDKEELICEYEEHIHEEICEDEEACLKMLAEEAADKVKDETADEATDELTDEIADEATDDPADEAAGKVALYASADDTSDETTEEMVEEEFVHEENSVTGKYHHAKNYKYYEWSAQELKQSDIMTFPLIPAESYREDWEPDTTEWSAKKDANYLVAYCAECLVTVSSGGADYGSFSIDNSRFATPELRNKISGVIAHSYPYITYEEMMAELTAAYHNGEIAVDITQCSKSEFMAATQAAIWQLLMPTMDFTNFMYDTEEAYKSEAHQKVTIIKDVEVGHTENAAIDAHCEAIMSWLLEQAVPEDLEVSSYEYEIEKDDYDLYTLKVNGTFNRPIIAGEIVSLQMATGNLATEETVLETGADSFAIQLANMTEEELLDAVVDLHVSGERMQAYYFEQSSYQDMISGQWESYDSDLSFQVTTDSTEVSVTKHWTEDVSEGVEVEVNLFANGKHVRETAILNAANDWTYTWTALPKTDVLGNAIVYTIQEIPMEGYYSTVTDRTGENRTVKVWEEADTLEAGEQYMFVSEIGGLSAYQMDDSQNGLTWTKASPEDVDACSEGLFWTAKAAENGEVYLYSKSVDAALGLNDILSKMYYRVRPYPESASDRWLTFQFENGYLKGRYEENANLDFSYIGVNGTVRGCGYFRDYTGATNYYGLKFTLYHLVEKETPPAEINYVLTNSKIRDDVKRMDVTVEKKWEGRLDGIYPESISVQLMQNGTAYDIPVELNAENNWTAAWSKLPEADNNGNAFVYTVEEEALQGYRAVQTAVLGEDGVYRITLTNRWEPEKTLITFKKIDLYHETKILPGAEFELYQKVEGGEELIPGTDNIYGILCDSIVIGEDGTAAKELAVGEIYYLVETKAPAGYEMMADAIGFTVSVKEKLVTITLLEDEYLAAVENGSEATFVIKNMTGYEIPKTGGTGTILYTMAGLVLSIGAGGRLYKKRQRKEEYL